MTTCALSKLELEKKIHDKQLEIFSLIWLDLHMNIKETRDAEEKLRSIINHLKKFSNVEQCHEYIQQTTQKDRLVLIVSGRLGQKIVPSIHKLRQVISIYVYCINKKDNEQWAAKFSKIKGVIVKLDELISRIKADYKIQKKIEYPLSINIFTTNPEAGKSTIEVNGEFIFSEIRADCLLRLKPTQTDKNELIDYLKNKYHENKSELNNIHEFEQEYSSKKALQWYTRESFFYKTLNAALRTQNIHVIFLFRSFIVDIQKQLQKYQSKNILRVYRGQLMSNNEVVNLKKHKGHFISVNSFFSTSKERATALFLLCDTNSSIDSERVLFEVNTDPNIVTTKPFADISICSEFPEELEVLFMSGSIFRLNNIKRSYDGIWIIRMTLCNDDEHDLKQVLMYMKQKIGVGETNLRTFGKILWRMGKLDLAEIYLHRFGQQLTPNDPLLGDLYEDLGELAAQQQDYEMSILWHKKSLIIKNENQLTLNFNISSTNTLIRKRSVRFKINNNSKQYIITFAGGNKEGNKLDQLNYPGGIYVDDKNQRIYIADYKNHRIIEWKFGANKGHVVAGGNGKGNQMNQLSHPTSFIVDEKDNSFIICDYGNRRVARWPLRNGAMGKTIISDIDCYGLTMDNHGDLYVSDWIKNEVRRWKIGDKNGTIVAGGNGEGSNFNQLNNPTYLFVDKNHSIYVSDCYNHRVMKWAKDANEGIIVAGGQGRGNSLRQLTRPAGVFVDQWKNVYVADSWNDRIMRWSKGSKKGSVVVGGNGQGNRMDQLNNPEGLSFDQKGNLYIIDQLNHRVQTYLTN